MKTRIDYHIPVLLNESISALALKDNGIYVDATLGGGGHSRSILNSGKNIRLYAFDKDKNSINYNSKLIERFPGKLTIIRDNFSNLRTRLALEKIKKIDGIIFDLGISFQQIAIPERGFSFQNDGKLDMRMNESNKISAFEIINNYSEEKLRSIFWEFGEERESGRIAKAIIRKRIEKQISTTLQLADIIDRAVHSRQQIKAKARIFQALRIHINDEMEELKTALQDSVNMLDSGGRIVVISYHSLEDRIVKNFFRNEEKDCSCPPFFPRCVCSKVSTIKIITKKPVVPDPSEIMKNKMARSAKMRIAEKKGVSSK